MNIIATDHPEVLLLEPKLFGDQRGFFLETYQFARYASSGKLEGIYELPLANTPLTRRFVTISGDGDVYFLRTKPSDIEVVGVGFRPMRNVSTIEVQPPVAPSPLQAFFDSFKATAAVRPSNRHA